MITEPKLSNKKKVEIRRRAETILSTYKKLLGDKPEEEGIHQEHVVDTISDVLHYATKRGWNVETLIYQARMHFHVENSGSFDDSQ